MREHAKMILILVAAFLGLMIGYALGKPIIAGLMLWLLGESARGGEFYVQLRDGLPGFLGGLIGALLVSWGFAYAVERWLGKHGLPGLILSAEEELAKSTVQMTITVLVAGTAPINKSLRVTLFSRRVPALPLAELFKDESSAPVVFKHYGELEVHLTRDRENFAAAKLDGLTDLPLTVTLKAGERVLHVFEVITPGKFKAPEGKNVAFCRFNLNYLGCEQNDGAVLAFKGPKSIMKDVFLE